jgi:hypothetical protein
MTRASIARRRRRSGRPKSDGNPSEEFAIALAQALQIAWQISERKALDLVIGSTEGEADAGGFRLPLATVSGRTSTLRKRRKRAGTAPDEFVDLLVVILRCRDLPAALRLCRGLLTVAQLRGPEVARQAIKQLQASA